MADVLILGGGVMGLAIALELRQAGLSVSLICRNVAEAASHAAAGMLAPQAEQLPPGPLLDLALRSRALYPSWIQHLETVAGCEAGYWPCGILAPRYEAGAGGDWVPTPGDRTPGLGPDVVGAYWYPHDAQVDNRALTQALWTAVQAVGVAVQTEVTVETILRDTHQVTGVQTSRGPQQAEHYILATGAWSQGLLSIPVYPQKGQLLAVQANPEDLPLHTVLFGSDVYIVPRRNGRIIVGATSESVGFAPDNTPAGIQTLLNRGLRLFPPLRSLPITELWWGFRPATPDQCPILGESPYPNLTLATGHHRNGILLAPITATLMAQWVTQRILDPGLKPFHWSRFLV
jgi:glycine oxidase